MGEFTKKEETDRFSLNILENCLSFTEEAIEKSITSKKNSRSWKFAIVHVVQAIELSLKELLRREHPMFIFTDIDNPKHTVSIQTAIKRLSKITKTPLSRKDIETIKDAQELRNQIIHKDVDFSIEQVRLLFAKLIGFLSYFHETHLKHHLVRNLPHDQYEFILQNQHFADELEKRAIQKITKAGYSEGSLTHCPLCSTRTFVCGDDINGTCFICNLNESMARCAGCNELFIEHDLKDFSNEFDYSNEGRQHYLENNYGYENYKSCEGCIGPILEDIQNRRDQEYYEQMEVEHHYRIRERNEK